MARAQQWRTRPSPLPLGGTRLGVDRMLEAEANRQPVPEIDGPNGNRQLGDLVIGEVLAQGCERGIGRARLGQTSDSLGPGEKRTLPGIVDRRFLPDAKEI